MRSLGRQEEFDDFHLIRMRDARAEQGRRNYLGEGLASGIYYYQLKTPLGTLTRKMMLLK